MSQFITNDYNTTFSSGVECASFVASSNLLRRPVETISELYAEISANQEEGLCFKVKQDLDLTVIAFVATDQINLEAPGRSDLVSSSALKDNNYPLFEFLCNPKFPLFSLHRASISLFHHHHEQLHQLKSLIDSSKPSIITGHALGGSIASLFTLWLLDDIIGSGRKRSPLCVTFGSPLLGDADLQKAISRSPLWNSCFLHVASLQDPLPRSFISTNAYRPFGTFLLCSQLGSACFNDPESIMELLAEARSTMSDTYAHQEFHIHQYSDIVQNLHRKAICKAFTSQPQNMALCDSLEATIIIQLEALGLPQIQQAMGGKLKLREITLQQKNKDMDPSKRLNDVKMYMANLEWYKKYSKAEETGMYDMYKKHRIESEQDIVWWKKELTLYWREMVEEAEMKPQKEGAAFRTRWLFAGTNYRRMVEPLDIADYYEGGGKDYENQGRSKHYRQLEEWLKEDRTTPSSGGLHCSTNKQNVESILTLDSCFWARMEEAFIACRDMMKSGEESSNRQKLSEFEEYVYGLLKNYAVSPEIFFKHSTYMRWWNGYNQMLKEASSDSKLASFMRNPDNYKLYSMGWFDFQ